MPYRHILTALAIASVGFTCKKEAPPPPAAAAKPAEAPAAKPADDTILVGAVLPLTGEVATFGTSSNNGIQLAVKEINAKGGIKGKKVVVKVLDSLGKAPDTAVAATRLITQDKVLAIIGESTSSNTLAAAPIADENKVPIISTSATNERVTVENGVVRPFVFRACIIDNFQGEAMAQFIAKDLKLKKIAILKDIGSDYSKGLADVFAESFKKLGGTIVTEQSFKAGDQDFKAQLTTIKAKKPEGIYIPAYYTDVSLIARQAKQLGINVPKFGSDGWDSEKLAEISQGALDGSYFTNHYSPESTDPLVTGFVSRYKAEFNNAIPDSMAALGYDAAGILFDAIGRAKELNPVAIRDALAATKGFQGATGVTSMDDKHNPVKSIVILKIVKNQPVYNATVNPPSN